MNCVTFFRLAALGAAAFTVFSSSMAAAQDGVHVQRQTNWVVMNHSACMTKATRAINGANLNLGVSVPLSNETDWLVGGNSPEAGVYIACVADNDSLQLATEYANRVLVMMTVSTFDYELGEQIRDFLRDCFFNDECGNETASSFEVGDREDRSLAIFGAGRRPGQFRLNENAGGDTERPLELARDLTPEPEAPPAPTVRDITWTDHAVPYREQLGSEFYFNCPARGDANPGRVWGTITYTTDSAICAAAKHAGFITDEGGQVHIQILDGRQSYDGVESNGITSLPYGEWNSSYEFILDD